MDLPSGVLDALAPVLPSLQRAGFQPVTVKVSASFGDFIVNFSNGRRELSIRRDRGQCIVSGPSRSTLKAAGLWRAFEGAQELSVPLSAWLQGDAGT